MRVQLYTDASIVKGRGAWAALVIRGDAPPVEKAGPLRGSFQSSTATELCAIANGLHFARRAGLIEPGDEVRVYCDNEAAVGRVNRAALRRASNDPVLGKVRRWIFADAREHGYSIKAEHVKGHQRLDSGDPRATYNIRCDHLCSAIRDGKEPHSWDDHVKRVDKFRRRKAARAMKEGQE